MLRTPLEWLFRRLGRRYLRLALFAQMHIAHVVAFGAVALLTLFTDASPGEFGRIVAVSQGMLLLENVVFYRVMSRLVRPADPWLRGPRDPANAVPAWGAVAGLARSFFHVRHALAVPFTIAPVTVYATWELDLSWWPDFEILVVGALVTLLYGAMLRFFALEVVTRPVVRAIARDLPADVTLPEATVGLRTRLLVALPAINVVTGVVASALASPDRSITGFGLGVAATVAVAATLSLELSLLLMGSILNPLRALRRGTDAVAAGDLSVRLPVLGSDEAGRLSASFNAMVAGLQEREQLREAFGAYVDPDVVERVLAEGPELAGEDVEVSVLFLDIRDFTAFAERSSARDVVGALNRFWALVVPVLARHGGHPNKFIGDGLLAVFGAPDRRPDHADRAVAAALDVVAAVRERYAGRVRIGVGVNTGEVVAGTVGGGGRVEFTVIGDTVNTAARVEAFTRETGDDVLVTEATRSALRADHGGFELRGAVELKGRSQAVELHAPCATARGRDELAPLAARRS